MNLPLRLPWTTAQDRWASLINPVLSAELPNGILLKNIPIKSGVNVVNHKLGRKLTGWVVTRMRASSVNIYDTQDTNQTPDLTLNLNASGVTNIDLWVF